jgi:hypothetical protein
MRAVFAGTEHGVSEKQTLRLEVFVHPEMPAGRDVAACQPIADRAHADASPISCCSRTAKGVHDIIR